MSSVLYLFVVYLSFVSAEFSWENCHGVTHDIKLLNVTVTPHPINAPGTVNIEITVQNEREIIAPVKAVLNLKKKLLFSSVTLPCVSGIGSCSFDDLCAICKDCACPLKPGDHVLKMPITIGVDSWAILGNYQGQIELGTASGLKGCVKVYNIHIIGASST